MAYIFGRPYGGVSMETLPQPKGGNTLAFLSFSGTGDSLEDVMDACAPMNGIQISQQVDYSMTKALTSDFLIAAFGDQPVQITISGLCVYGCKDSKNDTSIPDFYKRHRVSTKPKDRVILGLSMGKKNASFKCAIVGLLLEGSSEQGSSGVCSYRMTLIGVDATSKR